MTKIIKLAKTTSVRVKAAGGQFVDLPIAGIVIVEAVATSEAEDVRSRWSDDLHRFQ